MDYISVKNLTKLSGAKKRILQYWCKIGKVQSRQVYGNGGVRYEILVSSLPEDLQKKIADKSAFEFGGNAGDYLAGAKALTPSPSPAYAGEGAEKVSDVPTAVQATAQGSLNNKTGGVYPDSISGFILNSNNAGFSLKSNALTPTAQPPLTLGGNADCNA